MLPAGDDARVTSQKSLLPIHPHPNWHADEDGHGNVDDEAGHGHPEAQREGENEDDLVNGQKGLPEQVDNVAALEIRLVVRMLGPRIEEDGEQVELVGQQLDVFPAQIERICRVGQRRIVVSADLGRQHLDRGSARKPPSHAGAPGKVVWDGVFRLSVTVGLAVDIVMMVLVRWGVMVIRHTRNGLSIGKGKENKKDRGEGRESGSRGLAAQRDRGIKTR